MNHLNYNLLGEVLVVVGVNFRFLLSLGGWLLTLGFLGLFLLFQGNLKFFLSLLKVFGGFISNGETTLDTVVIELIKFNNATLVLLREEVGNRGLSRFLWPEHDDVKLILIFDSRWHLGLSLFIFLFSDLSLSLSLSLSRSSLSISESFTLFWLCLFLCEFC